MKEKPLKRENIQLEFVESNVNCLGKWFHRQTQCQKAIIEWSEYYSTHVIKNYIKKNMLKGQADLLFLIAEKTEKMNSY